MSATYRWTGYTYHDPRGRKITIIGRDPLLPDSRVLVERQQDRARWSVDRQRLETVIKQEGEK